MGYKIAWDDKKSRRKDQFSVMFDCPHCLAVRAALGAFLVGKEQSREDRS